MLFLAQPHSFFVTGTDTNVGKTTSAAMLLLQYSQLHYWKPVQTGADSDQSKIAQLTDLPASRFLPECYTFQAPLSPHRAAELENKQIELEKLVSAFQKHELNQAPLLVEGAGGLLVPLTRQHTWLDFLRQTKLNVVIAARSSLGTINHSLLTAEVLKYHQIPTLGFIFCGAPNVDNMRTVAKFTKLPILYAFELDDKQKIDMRKVWNKSSDPDGV